MLFNSIYQHVKELSKFTLLSQLFTLYIFLSQSR